jgi:hypothetical protein
LPSNDDLRIYEIFRERIIQEETLINYRMMWMLWFQAILLALWGGIAASSSKPLGDLCHSDWWIGVLMPFISAPGAIFAFLSFISIQEAKTEIKAITKIYMNKYSHIAENESIPSLTGTAGHHFWGAIVSSSKPWFLVVMWLFLAWYVMYRCWVML